MASSDVNEAESGKSTLSHYQESIRLLRELHFLMAEGKGDTEEADRVRDLMDDHWYHLSPQEVRRIEGLSADLYTLVDPPPPPQQLTRAEVDEFDRRAGAAWNNREWDRVLELLREQSRRFG